MQQAGMIRTRRGHIDILDEAALRQSACECYANNALQAERLTSGRATQANEQQASQPMIA
jgi:hypothetical protein